MKITHLRQIRSARFLSIVIDTGNKVNWRTNTKCYERASRDKIRQHAT